MSSSYLDDIGLSITSHIHIVPSTEVAAALATLLLLFDTGGMFNLVCIDDVEVQLPWGGGGGCKDMSECMDANVSKSKR